MKLEAKIKKLRKKKQKYLGKKNIPWPNDMKRLKKGQQLTIENTTRRNKSKVRGEKMDDQKIPG